MNILSKVISLQCSWVKRSDDNWKIIPSFEVNNPWIITPSYLIVAYLRKCFKFHSNLGIPDNKIKRFPIHHKQIFTRWSENLSSFPNLSSAIGFQFIWYNKCIKVDNKTIYNFRMS